MCGSDAVRNCQQWRKSLPCCQVHIRRRLCCCLFLLLHQLIIFCVDEGWFFSF